MARHGLVGWTTACLLVSAPALHAQTTNVATLEVTGGPVAGKHTLSAADVGCTIFEASKERNKPKYFDVNFGLPPTDPRSKDPKALTLVQVTVRNVPAKGPARPEDFMAALMFGPMGDAERGTFYLTGVDTNMGRKGGPGSVTLKDEGKRAELALDLQPKPGVTVKGTVACTRVNRR